MSITVLIEDMQGLNKENLLEFVKFPSCGVLPLIDYDCDYDFVDHLPFD